MQDFLIFLDDLLQIVADFLLTEPIYYFTGIVVLLAVVALVKRIIRI